MTTPIKLNEIMRFNDLSKVKVRFNLAFSGGVPIELYGEKTEASFKLILEGHHWNYGKKELYKEGDTTLAFIPLTIRPDDRWLLVYVGRVTKNLHRLNAVGYEYEALTQYDNLLGRLVVRFHNNSQNLVRRAQSLFDSMVVETILPDVYDGNQFPGYDNVNISWKRLSTVINSDSWKTALQYQKGVYLMTDRKKGKMYVGSAYGSDMLLSRWQAYIKTGHGGNKRLKRLKFDYIKNNFWFSILEIHKGSVDDHVILDRENYWKEVLRTREFGYNAN